MSLCHGYILDQRYQIEAFLGSGGMCEVYKARHVALDKTVALKLLHVRYLADATVRERFQREAIAMATLKHPNIAECYGFGYFGLRPYIAIEFVSGASLTAILREHGGSLNLAVARPIFEQICEALEHAHQSGIVHRDLKPSNVMITSSGGVKVVDFGIAKVMPESGKRLQTLTLAGEVLGSASYMSPEQCLADEIDERSDIYSLSCLMYEVLTGRVPFQGATALATMAEHVYGEAPDHASLGSARKAIQQGLAKDPSARPQTAVQVKQLLNDQDETEQRYLSKPALPVALAIAVFMLIFTGAATMIQAAGRTTTDDPKVPHLYAAQHEYQLGNIEMHRNHIRLALLHYERSAQSAWQAHAMTQYQMSEANLAACLLKTGRLQEAEAAAVRAMQTGPDRNQLMAMISGQRP